MRQGMDSTAMTRALRKRALAIAAQPHRPQPGDQDRIEGAEGHALECPEGRTERAKRQRRAFIRDVIGDARQEPIRFQEVLRVGGLALGAAGERVEIIRVLAVDVVAGHAQRALAARILRHHHHAIADLDPAGLRDRHDFADGLMPEELRLVAGLVHLVLGAHGGDHDLDQRPVFLRLRLGGLDQFYLLLSANDRLFSWVFPPH